MKKGIFFPSPDMKIGIASSGEDMNVGLPGTSQSSFPEEASIILDEDRITDGGVAPYTILPTVPERTLKEKLVERERQKRLETERARLKRQFALSNDMMMADNEENDSFIEDFHNNARDGSIVGTVGEGSSVAIIREDEDEKSEKLGYAMERFLSEQGQKKITIKVSNKNNHKDDAMLKKEEPGGVVMERFLSEPVVVVPPSDVPLPSNDNVVGHMVLIDTDQKTEPSVVTIPVSSEVATATVTFDNAASPTRVFPKLQARDGGDSEVCATAGSVSYVSSVGDEDIIVTMNSMDVDAHSNIAQVDDLDRFTEPDSPSQERSFSVSSVEGPRVLRLTEREIQEMAAIEEASIGNAPPSEREDTLSEVGDLVGSFSGGRDVLLLETPGGGFSVQTHTTASVSNTSAGGNQSRGGQSNDVLVDQHSIDVLDTASVSSHLVLSPGGSEADVSVTANPPSVVIPNDGEEEPMPSLHPLEEVLAPASSPIVLPNIPILDDPLLVADSSASGLRSTGIINRRIQPGVAVPLAYQIDTKEFIPRNSFCMRNELKRTISMPEITHLNVDGFNYDKHDYIPTTPRSNANDSFRDIPGGDVLNTTNTSRWDDPSMIVSPLYLSGGKDANNSSLMSGKRLRETSNISSCASNSIFNSINLDTGNFQEAYDSNMWIMGVPKRFRALLVTLMLEFPVLLIISGGSDPLYHLIGQKRYQLLMGFLLLSNAISGNFSIEASILTARALSHNQTRGSFRNWLRMEIVSAALLGLGMGTILGISAFTMSGFDVPFGFSIFAGQFVSFQVAGLTGTLTHLIFRHHSGFLQGFLETAVQDLVGSFVMVILSYHLLAFFSSSEADSTTICSAGLN
mmetsp:Transcript_41080/g.46679  ORF Transcript_41080/g.46679 Transcript_41080/m.46679 type:complete len:854 (+) Transcript_41080:166-2727(+)